MKKITGKRIVLIGFAVLILLGSAAFTAYLLLSNYQNVMLLQQAKANFLRNDAESLKLAEAQLLQLVRNDSDNESAYIMLGKIAEKNKAYPAQVYYCYMAHRLNPLSTENRTAYIRSLCSARYFVRLENLLAPRQADLGDAEKALLLYAAGRNGTVNKYKAETQTPNPLGDLAFLLFKNKQIAPGKKLEALKKIPAKDGFLLQEVLVSQAEIYLAMRDYANTEKFLKKAYELNEFAFAPAMGRFHANFRSFELALPFFEKFLSTYHDPKVAMQTAEIYCSLKQVDKIAKLRAGYQSAAGRDGMLCCYYFDAMTALINGNIADLKELVRPLRKNINTPLAAFMFFCVDLQSNDAATIWASYRALLLHRNYLDLQKRADDMVAEFLKSFLTNTALRSNEAAVLKLAKKLYSRKPDAITAKCILLLQKKHNTIDDSLLNDALKRFSGDFGIVKIGIEYYLNRDLTEGERLLTHFKKSFPDRKRDIQRYEIARAIQKNDSDLTSKLFQKHFSADIKHDYWTFASSTLRKEDLLFLSKDKEYGPFCRALLLLKDGNKKAACDILEKADAKKNYALLFFTAKTLAENGRNQAALARYAAFPENSPYAVAVMLNVSELLAENGELRQAEENARKAYEMVPDSPTVQYCYADKLFKNGNLSAIPDVVNLSVESAYRKRMEELWIAGMRQKIKDCNIALQREKLRELCRQLQRVAPGDNIAHEYLQKLQSGQ